MSLTGSMNAAVSGLKAQSAKLSTTSDNVANSSTTGYKRSETSFSSMVTAGEGSGVSSTTTQTVSEEGSYESTSSDTDLAISGDGYFVVQDSSGNVFLTRAGDFTEDENGYLVNSAGYTLLGYSYENGEPASVINGFDGLEPVKVTDTSVSASATTSGTLDGNLDSSATAVTGDTASANSSTSEYSKKTSIIAYDSLGNSVQYDVYFTKTADNEWEVTAYRTDEATDETGFPYTNGSLGTTTISFDSSTGELDSSSASSLTITDSSISPALSFTLDLSDMTQTAADYSIGGDVDGAAAASVSGISIDTDGNIVATYSDGSTSNLYKIALATVPSPDNLTSVDGTAYQVNAESGTVVVGFANSGSFGSIESSTLETSNVDLADELTNMIVAQRAYTANSKVFQTASEMLDTLTELKR
ncbi:flagellar hook protein FlgE [Allorhizobium undicola]|uniref:flagellar hook protein FlgE n=1 Tax=Allorhizobium undicola TaxID=78527 RepID=UPI000484E0F5|nr:flagellar hook protein FlgE [Allorhizobium undicola]